MSTIRRVLSSFTVQFAVVSLVAVLGLGVVLALVLGRQVESRVIEDTVETISVSAEVALLPLVMGPEDVDHELTAALSERLSGPLGGNRVRELVIWNSDLEVVFASAGLPDDHTSGESDSHIGATLAGVSEVEIENVALGSDVDARPYLEMYAPLRGAAGEIVGGFEAYLDYAPVSAAIRSEQRTIFLWLLSGLAVLWAILFRLVVMASSRIRLKSEENRHLALHDQLTGLPNRTLFEEVSRSVLTRSLECGRRVGVVLIDLDRFKEVNDTLGHHHGDLLLGRVAARLQHMVRGRDVVARLGGDEFVLLLTDLDGSEHARAVLERVLTALDEPFEIEGISLVVEASAGVVIAPDDGTDFTELLQRADMAMYRAKELNHRVELFDAGSDVRSLDRLSLVTELRSALTNDEFEMYFQPQVDLASGSWVCMESLIRWNHPSRGLMLPGEFIDVVESSGLIRPLTQRVLALAVAQLRDWEQFDISVSVNVSARSFFDAGICDDVASALESSGVAPERLTLEITETSMLHDPECAARLLSRLRDLGVTLAVDDFGVGHASLAYLRLLPVQELKIDQTFVSTMLPRSVDEAIVSAAIQLGQQIGLRVVAEGVESPTVFDRLRELGCDRLQGWLIARPLPAREATEALAAQRFQFT